MAGEIHFLSGKGRWCRFFTPSEYGKYGCEFCPNEEGQTLFMEWKKAGIRNQPKTDDNGIWWHVSRPATIELRGATRPNEPPVVLDADGNPWPRDKEIGNMSDLTLKINFRTYKVRATGKEGVAIRLEGARVDSLINFDTQRDWPDSPAKNLAKGLMDQPAKPWEVD